MYDHMDANELVVTLNLYKFYIRNVYYDSLIWIHILVGLIGSAIGDLTSIVLNYFIFYNSYPIFDIGSFIHIISDIINGRRLHPLGKWYKEIKICASHLIAWIPLRPFKPPIIKSLQYSRLVKTIIQLVVDRLLLHLKPPKP